MDHSQNGSKRLTSDVGQAQPQGEMDALLLGRTKELVSSGQDERDWRGIGIALLVIILVSALIVTAIFLLSPGYQGSRVKGPRLNLIEVLDGSLTPRKFNGTWMSEKEFIFRDSDGHLILYNAESVNKTLLMSNTTFRLYDVHTYSLSADRKYVLFAYAIRKRFRYSYTAKYKYFDIRNYQTSPLLPSEEEEELQYVSWGPTGNQLVYVRNNDIYYMAYVGDIPPKRITRNGVDKVIFNGIPDWVYEEEILGKRNPIWWSEDGTRLCFASFDDSGVSEVRYPWYGDYMEENNIYPNLVNIRYPKPGTENPIATLWIADVTFTSSIPAPRRVRPPKQIQEREHYFTQVTWIDRTRLAIIWLRRTQNFSVVSVCHERNGWACDTNLEETSKTGWIDMYDPPIFTADKKYYFLRLPVMVEKFGSFRHIAMISVNDKRKRFLTEGAYDVIQVMAHRPEARKVYYISTLKNKSGQRHLFSITDLTSPNRSKECLTCNIGDRCLFNSATFSPGAKFYILECLGPGIPKFELRAVDGNKLLYLLDNNSAFQTLYQKRALPQVRTFHVPLESGFIANVRLLLTPGLRDDDVTQYPMVVYVDGAPGHQLVTERFEVHWGTYLASRKNFIYAMIDGRGSGNRGDQILHQIYKKLGSVEIEDQITVSRYLKNDLPFIDPDKIAIWGWSYGGYAAAMTLATDTNVFKCGISVAPVTCWRYYDSVYTERYMQSPSPDQNFLAYEKSSLVKKAANLKGKKFLLIHGSNDDKVHLQQSMILIKALTDAGVLFQTQIYPDEDHKLANVPLHFYQTMEAFFDQCFNIPRKGDIGLQKTSKKVFIGGR
ncbi:dipeptidyl peptidase 4-like isoform X2 [Tachypleus tridentatus]|uniref:dipeptidyl peptidase 4-like isoform X2 n=1 Tax=Tachypleus tridentatus TaxID=6853 RepID=UPI003FCF8A4B